MLCEQGTIGREFFLIVKGQASVRRNNRKVATLGPGQYFGEMALLDRRPRSATVISDTEMTLLVLGQRQFNGVLDAVPALSRKMLAAMATRLREADDERWPPSRPPPFRPAPHRRRARGPLTRRLRPGASASAVCRAARLSVSVIPRQGHRRSPSCSWTGESSLRSSSEH